MIRGRNDTRKEGEEEEGEESLCSHYTAGPDNMKVGENVELRLSVTLEDLYLGKEVKVRCRSRSGGSCDYTLTELDVVCLRAVFFEVVL